MVDYEVGCWMADCSGLWWCEGIDLYIYWLWWCEDIGTDIGYGDVKV